MTETSLTKQTDNTALIDHTHDSDFRSLRRQWQKLNMRMVENASAAATVLAQQMRILKNVHEKYGPTGFHAFCEGNGISKTTAYNYIEIMGIGDEKKVKEILSRLTISKVIELLPTLKIPGCAIDENGLMIEGETVVTADELENMSVREVRRVARGTRQSGKPAGAETGDLHKQIESKNREIGKMRQQYNDLKESVEDRGIDTEENLFLTSAVRYFHQLKCFFEYSFAMPELSRKAIQKRTKIIGEIVEYSEYLNDKNLEFIEYGHIVDEPESVEAAEIMAAAGEATQEKE